MQTEFEISPNAVDLHDKESRSALAQMAVRLFEHWQLNPAQQAALLGLSSDSRSSVARYKKGHPLADNTDLIRRVGHLLGIHKSLRILFPHDRDLAYQWVRRPHAIFQGQAPVELMVEHGYEGILAVRRYLDFERGR